MNLTWLFVAVVFTIASRVARLPLRAAILFFAVTLGFLWAPLTQPVVMISSDVIKLTAPWSELHAPGRPPVSKYEVSNLGLQDVPLQIAPWMHQVREQWRRLEVPLWNGAAGGGYPLLANGQSTPLSPLRILTLPLSLDHAMAAECALKLLLAMSLTYLFCRKRHSELASVVAALSYGVSTWMTVWLQFPIASAAAFLPGVMLVSENLIERWTRGRFLAATLMYTATVFAGQPETTFEIGVFTMAFGVWVAWIERREPKRILNVAAASCVAMLLSGPSLVPFAESVVRSERLQHLREIGDVASSPFPPLDSASLLLQPSFFGQLPNERPWGAATADSICGFAGVLPIAACVTTVIQVARRRAWRMRETLYALAFLFCVGAVLHWVGFADVFYSTIGRAPGVRLRFGICWFGALLAASALDWLRDDRRWPLLAGCLAVAIVMAALLQQSFPTPSHRVSAVLSLLPSIAVLLAITLLPLRRDWAGMLLGILILAELLTPVSRWNSVLLPRDFYPRTPLITRLEELRRGDHDPFRILGTGSQIYPNSGVMFGFDDARVHDPMAPRRYLDLLHETIGWEPTDYYEKWRDTDTTLLDLLNVKYVVTEPGRTLAAPRYSLLYDGRDGRIFSNASVLPLFFPVRSILPQGNPATHTDWRYTAIVTRVPRRDLAALLEPWSGRDARVEAERRGEARYRLRVDAPRTTLVVSSLMMFPGWTAGPFPVIEVNGMFVGVVVPAGRHVIDLAYRPRSFYASAVISLLTLMALLAMARRRAA